MAELIAILIGSVVLLILLQLAQRAAGRLNRDYYQKKWREIKVLEQSSAAAQRLAVIEGDKVLDKAMKESGIKGATTGDRLKSAGSRLGDIGAVWTAHKLRNRLVHEESKPKPRDIRQAIKAYQNALKKLGAL